MCHLNRGLRVLLDERAWATYVRIVIDTLKDSNDMLQRSIGNSFTHQEIAPLLVDIIAS